MVMVVVMVMMTKMIKWLMLRRPRCRRCRTSTFWESPTNKGAYMSHWDQTFDGDQNGRASWNTLAAPPRKNGRNCGAVATGGAKRHTLESFQIRKPIMEQYGNNEKYMIMIIRDDHATKSDEFSGKFQTAFASPLIFEKLYCNFFRRRPKKALYKGPKSAK